MKRGSEELSSPGDRWVAVANPGTHPEPAHLAAGLRSAGVRVTYFTSSMWARDSAAMRLSAKGVDRLPIARMWLARALPEALSRSDVRGSARLAELRFQITRRLWRAGADKALNDRTLAFRKTVARWVSGRASLSAVVAQQTAALEVFEAAAPGVRRILMYPIAHHRWMAQYLGQESAENPDWSEFLQGHNRTQAELRRLDREIELADDILVPSNFVRETFLSRGVEARKLHVQALGADLGDLGDASAQLPWENDGLRVLFVGQITQRKGISYMLEGYDRAKLKSSQLTLIGSAVPGISDAIAAYPAVKTLPPKPRSELAGAYSSADVLVLASLAEGFPLAAIEAMACGTPCIISDKTFAGDVVTDGFNGIIVPARDAAAITSALQSLDADRSRLASMSSAARDRALDFTWQSYELTASALVDSILTGRLQ